MRMPHIYFTKNTKRSQTSFVGIIKKSILEQIQSLHDTEIMPLCISFVDNDKCIRLL